MMRSLFSGISGLKVHQTKMDVIGNNISNVNTIGFRSGSVNFTDVFYQTTQGASGPNAETGAAGTNAMQIGLGANVASIAVDLSGTGATQRTDRGMDVMINGDAFFILRSNGQTYFGKSGALDIDANGTLYCTTNGASILGWKAVENEQGQREIRKDTVDTLNLMGGENQNAAPQATTGVSLKGNIDRNDPQVQYSHETGYPLSMGIYDNVGDLYSVKMALKKTGSTDATSGTVTQNNGEYAISITDIMGPDGKSALVNKVETEQADGSIKTEYEPTQLAKSIITIDNVTLKIEVDKGTGVVTITPDGTGGWPTVKFDEGKGGFREAGSGTNVPEKNGEPDLTRVNITIGWKKNADGSVTNMNGSDAGVTNFPTTGTNIKFSDLTMYASQGGVTSVKPYRGDDTNNEVAGNMAGTLSGFTIQQDGRIFGNYSNGDKKLLGQIAFATFPNPSGLESVGNSMYSATKNSGDFDGVGIDISEVGKLSIGALEMSDVDLATEFTNMITTQRGFQANSRIITTSDSMLEELVNLKR